jgi:hypothetical protein
VAQQDHKVIRVILEHKALQDQTVLQVPKVTRATLAQQDHKAIQVTLVPKAQLVPRVFRAMVVIQDQQDHKAIQVTLAQQVHREILAQQVLLEPREILVTLAQLDLLGHRVTQATQEQLVQLVHRDLLDLQVLLDLQGQLAQQVAQVMLVLMVIVITQHLPQLTPLLIVAL